MSSEEAARRGGRLRALREALQERFPEENWSQEKVAERSPDLLKRTYVNRIETGANKATSSDLQRGLAIAYGVDVKTIAALLRGDIDVQDVVAEHVASRPKVDRYPARQEAIDDLVARGAPVELLDRIRARPELNEGHEHDLAHDWLKTLVEALVLELVAGRDPAIMHSLMPVLRGQAGARARARETRDAKRARNAAATTHSAAEPRRRKTAS